MTETIGARFAAAAAAAGDRPAVTDRTGSISYRELDRRARRLAADLAAHGAGPETRVALLLPREIDLVVGMVATALTGAAYVPLDDTHPRARHETVLADTAPVALVSRQGRSGLPVVHPDPAGPARPCPPPAGHPEHPAYVIHTSGSTGRPKGVLVTHRNVLAMIDATAPVLGPRPDDVWSAVHSCAFDFSVWEIWGALLSGGSVVLLDRADTWSPADLARRLADARVTVLSQTPSAFARLCTAERARLDGGGQRLAVRAVVFGGEALDVSRLGPWRDRYPGVALVNMYGITETTVHVTHLTVGPGAAGTAAVSPIGAPLAGLDVLVLDDRLDPVGAGGRGEMYVRGPQVARGYLGAPALTAARFVADPAGGGGRLYRSGDRAEIRADGTLHYLGRSDDQVQIRGVRVEPGEVQSVLAAVPGVADCAVVADHSGPQTRLVGYLVVPGGGIDPAGVRAALAATLPVAMIPADLVLLDALPLTVNGKLDRAALPPPGAVDTTAGETTAADTTAADRRRALIRSRRAATRPVPTGGRP